MTYPATVSTDPENIEGTDPGLGVNGTGFTRMSSFLWLVVVRASYPFFYIFEFGVRARTPQSTPATLPNATGVAVVDSASRVTFVRFRGNEITTVLRAMKIHTENGISPRWRRTTPNL